MKKFFLAGSALMFFAAATLTSCGSKDAAPVSGAPVAAADSGSLNIRFIDLDSVSANYNLVKDYQEVSLRTMSKLDNAQRTKQAELQKRAAEIENKMKNHGYISEATYNADVQKFQQQQRDAEIYLGNLQQQAQQEALDQSRALNDSLNSFIAEYVKTHAYDAILYKAAGAYFNPALDITNEIVAGLNARYKKPEELK